MKKQKTNSKNLEKKKLDNKKVLIVIISSVVLLAVIFVVGSILTSKQNDQSSQKGLSLDDFYSEDSCRCLERELNRCLSGFELTEDGNFCMNQTLGTYTNVVKGCSSYECSGVNYDYNFDSKDWRMG
mgnify:FL=1